MSGTFPSSPAPSSVIPKSLQPSLSSTAHSLKRQTRSKGGQRWSFKISYGRMRRDEMAPLIAFALAQRGQFGTFLYIPPVIGSRRAGSGALTVRTATLGGRAVPVQGPASTRVASIGDYVKFANGSKVYMLTADVQTNASGQATLSIEPALYAGVSVGEGVVLDNVPFTVFFASDLHETPIEPPLRFKWDCELVEELP